MTTIAALLVMVHQARLRVVAERASAAELADHLAAEAVAALPPGAPDAMTRLQAVIASLPALRHVRVSVAVSGRPAGGESADGRSVTSGTPPRWFFDLLRPPPWELRHPIMMDGRRLGEVVISGDPSGEISELWDEMVLGGAMLLGLMVVFVGVVFWLVGQALHPLFLLGQGLGRLEQGNFNASLPPFDVPELADVGMKFNSLARSLARISGDNRFLIQKLISVQESERNMLAHELHDELGPCLFGIKAQAACIVRAARETAETDHAKTILGLVDDLQRLNRRILGRLRPLGLHDLGLVAAVGQLVDDWRGRAPEVDWQFRCVHFEAPSDESLALSIYRIIQECLTNAARHSGASRVVVEIGSGPAGGFGSIAPSWRGDPDFPVAYVAVGDNGRGRDEGCRRGFGLLGIHERVEGHGGVVTVNGGGGTGTLLEALLPLGPLVGMVGAGHA
ncbi:histidine kinase [Telmatospirillum siberiense]|uniref:histidine kinase n=1 Tax=Telmatospirillum siberiense TaxID=382514 RepID=UPI0011AF2B5A|nr:histidine kinase [Telmatospirillum siberiense]